MMIPRFVLATLCSASLCLAAPDAPAQEADADSPAVEPMSLQITRELKGVDEDEDIVNFAGQTGTEVKLLIKAGKKGIIGFDDDKSELTSFKDDKGTDLLKNKSNFGFNEGFSWFRTTKKGDLATLDVRGDKTPAKGAESLKITGTLVLTVASKQQEHKQAGIILEKGADIKAGPFSCEVTKANKSEWEEGAFDVSLTFKQDATNLADVQFLDGDGKVIEKSLVGTSRTAGFGLIETTYGYELKKQVKPVTVVFKVWTDAETVKLPVDLVVDVGL